MSPRHWSQRLLVESCQALDASDLHQAGVFRAWLGTPSTVTWKTAQTVPKLVCWVKANDGSRSLHLCYTVDDPSPRTIPIPIEYDIGLQWTACQFGGRRPWFLCPGVSQSGLSCSRRVRTLYLPPGARWFCCRTCWSLTYASTRHHDSRVSVLLKDTDLLRKALESQDLRKKLLGLKATNELLRRALRRGASGNSPK